MFIEIYSLPWKLLSKKLNRTKFKVYKKKHNQNRFILLKFLNYYLNSFKRKFTLCFIHIIQFTTYFKLLFIERKTTIAQIFGSRTWCTKNLTVKKILTLKLLKSSTLLITYVNFESFHFFFFLNKKYQTLKTKTDKLNNKFNITKYKFCISKKYSRLPLKYALFLVRTSP